MTAQEVFSITRAQLSIDLNCSSDDFDRDGFVFCEAKENVGRRPFPRGERHFEMLTMGRAIIVSATADILPYVREQLEGRSRDEAFVMPFVSGHGLYYLPDAVFAPPVADGVELSLVERADIPSLYELEGFRNAIMYDIQHPRPDVLVTLAKIGGVIVGMAGASADCARMWQIGVDVLPTYRRGGLAAALTGMLAEEILRRGKVPYYGTSTANIPSQRVAHRAGFRPAWMCAYRGLFGGVFTGPTG